MTPEEIEILIQEAQTLIEQIRAETQKGGNTKERVANTLAKLNNVLTELNERPSGGGDFIPLSGTEEGKPLTGSVNIGSENLVGIYHDTPQNIGYIEFDNGNIIIASFSKGNNTSSSLSFNGLDLNLDASTSSRGIIGSDEFDKQGDRKAFAQMSDVYDNMGGLNLKEDKANKIITWATPTDTQYPSAKLVKDSLNIAIYSIDVSQDGNVQPVAFTRRVNLDYLKAIVNVSSFDNYQLFYGTTVGTVRNSLSELQDDINALTNTQVLNGYSIRFRVVLEAGKDFATAELKTTDI